MMHILCSADLPMNFEDRVAAVGIATQFQECSNEVFKMVEEETEYAKTQVICFEFECFVCELILTVWKFSWIRFIIIMPKLYCLP